MNPQNIEDPSQQQQNFAGYREPQPPPGNIQPPQYPASPTPIFTANTFKIMSLVAAGLIVLGFLLPWGNDPFGGKSYNGIYVTTELLKASDKSSWFLILALFVAAIPVCSVLFFLDRLSKGYSKLRYSTFYLAFIVFLPLLFFSGKQAVGNIPIASQAINAISGAGLGLMVLGVFYLIFDNVFHLCTLRTNMHTAMWMRQPVLIGTALATIPGMIIYVATKDNPNALLYILSLAFFIAGIVIAAKIHQASLGGYISMSRTVGVCAATVMATSLIGVILYPIINASFGIDMKGLEGLVSSLSFMINCSLGYFLSNIIACAVGWEPANGYDFKKPVTQFANQPTSVQPSPVQPSVQPNPQAVGGQQQTNYPPQYQYQSNQNAVPPAPQHLVKQSQQPAPSPTMAMPQAAQIERTPAKPLSEQLQPLFDFIKENKKIIMASAGGLFVLLMCYSIFLKPNPMKEGQKAAIMLCDCDKGRNGRLVASKSSFLKEIEIGKYPDRGSAMAAAKNFTKEDQAYFDCQRKANEYKAGKQSKYIAEPENSNKFINAYNQQFSIVKMDFSAEQANLDGQINQKIAAMSSMVKGAETMAVSQEAGDIEEAEMEGGPSAMYVTANDVNARDQGSLYRTKILFEVDKGEVGYVVGERTDSRGEKWIELSFNGKNGWVSGKYLSTDQYFESKWQKAVINDPDGYTNIRDAASSKGNVMGKVFNNQELTVIETGGDWWLVETADQLRGYMHKSRIRIGEGTATTSSPTSSSRDELILDIRKKYKNINSKRLGKKKYPFEVAGCGTGTVTYGTYQNALQTIVVKSCIGDGCSSDEYYFWKGKLMFVFSVGEDSYSGKTEYRYYFKNNQMAACKKGQEFIVCDESVDLVSKANALKLAYRSKKVGEAVCN